MTLSLVKVHLSHDSRDYLVSRVERASETLARSRGYGGLSSAPSVLELSHELLDALLFCEWDIDIVEFCMDAAVICERCEETQDGGRFFCDALIELGIGTVVFHGSSPLLRTDLFPPMKRTSRVDSSGRGRLKPGRDEHPLFTYSFFDVEFNEMPNSGELLFREFAEIGRGGKRTAHVVQELGVFFEPLRLIYDEPLESDVGI